MSRAFLLSLCLVCIVPGLAFAVPVSITNAGFESPALAPASSTASATGWTITGISGGGVFNYNGLGTSEFDVPAPEGQQVGYLSSGPSGTASMMEQIVGVVQPYSIYTLTGFASHPKSGTLGLGTIYGAELIANGTTVLATSGGHAPVGTYEQFTTVFDSTNSVYVGATLSIRLTTNKAQTEFDVIALDQLEIPPAPEPSTLLLASCAAVGILLSKRNKTVRFMA